MLLELNKFYVQGLLTLQSSYSRIVCLLMLKVNQDIQGNDILLTLQGVSFTEALEGLKSSIPQF